MRRLEDSVCRSETLTPRSPGRNAQTPFLLEHLGRHHIVDRSAIAYRALAGSALTYVRPNLREMNGAVYRSVIRVVAAERAVLLKLRNFRIVPAKDSAGGCGRSTAVSVDRLSFSAVRVFAPQPAADHLETGSLAVIRSRKRFFSAIRARLSWERALFLAVSAR